MTNQELAAAMSALGLVDASLAAIVGCSRQRIQQQRAGNWTVTEDVTEAVKTVWEEAQTAWPCCPYCGQRMVIKVRCGGAYVSHQCEVDGVTVMIKVIADNKDQIKGLRRLKS